MTAVDTRTGEILDAPTSDLALRDLTPGDIDAAADPGAFVVLACERAKSWLDEALTHGDIGKAVEVKAIAETLRVATVQKQLGKDSEVKAQEIVRRAERAIGVCIRMGQEAGEIARASREVGKRSLADGHSHEMPKPLDIDRIVRASGLVVSKAKQPGAIGAVGTLTRIYNRAGAGVLRQTITTVRDSFGDAGFEGRVPLLTSP